MKKFDKTLLTLALVSMFAPATVSLADDTDIYAANNGTANNPNVLVIIDNSANWASASQHWPGIKQGQAELNALRTVTSELGTDINLGLMMFTPGSGSAKDGGYVRFHVRQMDATNKNAFRELLGDPSGCTDGANSLNGTPNCIYQNFSGGSLNESVGTAKTDYSATMFEAYKYFGGYTCPAHATDDVARCSTGVDDASHFGALRYAGDPETRSDTAAYSSVDVTGGASRVPPPLYTYYVPPLSAANSCAKNYVIIIGNGYPTQDSASTLLTGVGGDATALSVPDFTESTTTHHDPLSTTALGTYAGNAAGQAACEAAAATTYGAAYSSYTCAIAGSSSSTVTTALSTTAYGTYPDAASCTAAETAANSATYDSVTCTLSGTSTGSTTLAATACGLGATAGTYASAAACTSAETAANAATYPGGVTCTQIAGNCSYTTSTGTQTSSCRADVASCNANAASDYVGPPWSSRSCGAVVTANCTYAAAATQTFCSDDLTHCGTQATAAGFNAAGLTKDYTSTNCVPNVAGYKQCNVSGTKNVNTGNTYTITGTATSTTGLSFSRVGLGAATYSFSRTGSKTTTTYSHNISGNYTTTAIVPTGTSTGTSANYADEWAKFLYQTDVNSASGQQNVRTYAIDVFKDAQDANQTKLLMNMAAQGGGKYFSATDEDAIKDALRKIFSEIQSVNSVFASSSLPVSVNTQGTYLNQVFIGMFRPDGSAKPRWAGNLKQYQFAINSSTSTMFLADKNNDPAISSSTGFITPCADSMWTTDSGSTYWNFGASNAKGSCGAQFSAFPAAGSSSMYSDGPDGDVVEKGGAAQRLRGVFSSAGVLTASSQRYAVCTGDNTPATANCRKLLTCNNASCSALLEFSTTNAGAASSNPSLTAANVSAADDTERDLLINWVRGQDVDDENANTVTTEVRPSVHGAVVHSQPAVVDYGGSTGVYAFYGADDGVFHAIDGGKTDAEGIEAWGFVAPETYGRLKRFRSNDPLVYFPDMTPPVVGAIPKSYFFDGSVGVYQHSSTVWIYPTMRRGGRAIYAFDVSTPTSPTLKWRKGCFTNSTTDDSNCSTGWTGIGQTWSKPQIGYLSGYVDGSTQKPVLIFGGGYDTCEDTDSQTRCATTPRKGANIWFVDADTGAVLRTYPTNYSVAGDVFLSKDSSGNVTYVHAVDTGGYVYRINVSSTNTTGSTFTSWSSNSAATDIDIANMSETNHARKFLFGPDVVRYPTYTAVMVGSGDREHPMLNSYACGTYSSTAGAFVTNQFFMIKDTPDAYPGTLITPSSLTDVTSTSHLIDASTISASGWRFSLLQCEQVVNKALSIGGVVYFGTNQPTNTATTACSSNLGIARGYAIDILNGAAPCATCSRSTTYVGGGLPPSPVAGVVDIDGIKVPFLLGGSKSTGDVNCVGEGCSALGGAKIEINPTGARYRMFWYIQND